MKILTETNEEYQTMKKLFPTAVIFKPEDCIFASIWSIDDIETNINKKTSIQQAKDIFYKQCGIEQYITQTINEILSDLPIDELY
jgi:hypothetical protein